MDGISNLFDSLKLYLSQEPDKYKVLRYNKEKNLIENSSFVLTNNEWIIDRSYKYKYNTHNLLIETTKFNSNENVWEINESYEYKYNENNNVIEQTTFNFYKPLIKTEYIYDTSNEGSIIYDNSNYIPYAFKFFVFVFEIIYGTSVDIYGVPEKIQQRSKLDKIISYKRNVANTNWNKRHVQTYHYSEREIAEVEPEEEEDPVNFSIFPNPASRFVMVNYHDCQWNASAEIYNLDGNLLKSAPISLANNMILLQGLSTGTYILKIQDSDGKVHTFKILKN